MYKPSREGVIRYIGGSRNFWKGGGLQPLMTTLVHYSVRKGGCVVEAPKMVKIDLFWYNFPTKGVGGVATPATLPLDPQMVIVTVSGTGEIRRYPMNWGPGDFATNWYIWDLNDLKIIARLS